MNRQKSFENNQPTLYLVATPIGNLDEMTYRSINILNEVNYIAAEDTRNTVKLLNHFNISTKLISHHEHNIKQSIPKLISLLEEGNDIALVSDAGYPAISDPGYELVKEAISKDINVVPISGCNACLDALVVSGIAPQPFLFYGFLDHLDKKKKKELQDLKKYINKNKYLKNFKDTKESTDILIQFYKTYHSFPNTEEDFYKILITAPTITMNIKSSQYIMITLAYLLFINNKPIFKKDDILEILSYSKINKKEVFKLLDTSLFRREEEWYCFATKELQAFCLSLYISYLSI